MSTNDLLALLRAIFAQPVAILGGIVLVVSFLFFRHSTGGKIGMIFGAVNVLIVTVLTLVVWYVPVINGLASKVLHGGIGNIGIVVCSLGFALVFGGESRHESGIGMALFIVGLVFCAAQLVSGFMGIIPSFG